MINRTQGVVHRTDNSCRGRGLAIHTIDAGRRTEDTADDRHHQGGLYITAWHIANTENDLRADVEIVVEVGTHVWGRDQQLLHVEVMAGILDVRDVGLHGRLDVAGNLKLLRQ